MIAYLSCISTSISFVCVLSDIHIVIRNCDISIALCSRHNKTDRITIDLHRPIWLLSSAVVEQSMHIVKWNTVRRFELIHFSFPRNFNVSLFIRVRSAGQREERAKPRRGGPCQDGRFASRNEVTYVFFASRVFVKFSWLKYLSFHFGGIGEWMSA